MALIKFTEEEVRAVLPRRTVDAKVSTARSWEMFSDTDPAGKYGKGEEAAQYVADRLVEILTNGVKFDPADEFAADDLASAANSLIYDELQTKYGTGFGFSDTEPRYHMAVVFRKLLGQS